MSPRQILIEPSYSIERSSITRGSHSIKPQPDFLIIFVIKSGFKDINSSSCLFVNPNQLLELGRCSRNGELLILRIAPQLLVEKAARFRMHQTGAELLFRSRSITSDDTLINLFSSIAGELDERSSGWRDMIGSLVDQMAVYLLRNNINARRSDAIELSRVGMVDRRLRKAIEFMHDNCGRDLTLAEIAAAAFLSEYHFARLFKKVVGTSPHAYLASIRIDRARRLLAETDMQISEVGALVGYAGQSHFTKIFREFTGMTPKAFREAVNVSHGVK